MMLMAAVFALTGAGNQFVDAEVPRHGQEIGMPFRQVVTEQVEDRRDRNNVKEPHCANSRALMVGRFMPRGRETRANQRVAPGLPAMALDRRRRRTC